MLGGVVTPSLGVAGQQHGYGGPRGGGSGGPEWGSGPAAGEPRVGAGSVGGAPGSGLALLT